MRQRKTALDAPLYAVSAGRSMIEMLGVLAIIAVLTVGGIAGYSKAMKKYQANKVVGEIIQVFANLKELSENDSRNNIRRLDDETKKTLGLCLPSAENCSGYQRTPVGEISISYSGVSMRGADAELCISAFNNIVTPLKGNIRVFTVSTKIKNRDGTSSYSDILISENERMCDPSSMKCLNPYDSRVATEINAACNSGIDKKVLNISIIFKNGFIGGY